MKISLKALRVNAKFSQEKIADRMGVSRATVANWESGKTKIPGEELLKLCEIYGVSEVKDIFLPTTLTESKEKKAWTS